MASTSTKLSIALMLLFSSHHTRPGLAIRYTAFRSSVCNTRPQYPAFYTLLEREVRTCETKSVALVFDGNNHHLQNPITKFYSRLESPYIQREGDINNETVFEFQKWLRQVYIEDRVRDFVLVVENPRVVLEMVESAFLSDQRGRLAVLPSMTRWLVITWTRDQWEQVKGQQLHSVLDNVAVIQLCQGVHEVTVCDVSTFMWREHRTRQPSRVNWDFPESDGHCAIYPNRFEYNGLNGRRLTVIAKSDFEAVVATRRIPATNSSNTSSLVVTGILVSILNYSSELLNFTYDFLDIEDDPSLEYSTKWQKHRAFVIDGRVDIGLSPWALLYGVIFNTSLSYPVQFDRIVGVYRISRQPAMYDSIFFLCPFPSIIYVFLFIALIFTSALYATIVNVYYHSETSDKLRKKGFLTCSAERPNNLKMTTRDKGDDDNDDEDEEEDGASIISTTSIFNYLEILSFFSSAILNQSYLPRPRQNSSRLLVMSWAICLLFYNAMFSSYYTAEMVKKQQDAPITNFEDLLKNADYKCAAFENSVVSSVLSSTKPGTILDKIKSRTTYIKRHVTNDNYSTDLLIHNTMASLGDKVVFLHYQTLIRKWLWSNGRESDYMVMQDDPLLKTDFAIMFPPGSDLTRVVSSAVLTMYESGLYDEATSQWFAPQSEGGSRTKEDASSLESSVRVHDIFWLSVVCGLCIVTSAIMLVIEVLVGDRKHRRISPVRTPPPPPHSPIFPPW